MPFEKKEITEKESKVSLGTRLAKVRVERESKADLFNRLATSRVEKVLKALRILSNCSNRSIYEYTQEQVDAIAIAINKALEKAITKFHDTKKEEEKFAFSPGTFNSNLE